MHSGDSMRKDYLPAKSVGMRALLVDRFIIQDTRCWWVEAIWCHFASRLDGFKRFAYFRKFNLLRGICLSHSWCACTSSSPSCSLEFSDKSFSAGVPPKFCFCSMFSHTTINFFFWGGGGADLMGEKLTTVGSCKVI